MASEHEPMPWEFATLRDRLFGSLIAGVIVTMALFWLVGLLCCGVGQVEQNEVFDAALPYTMGAGAVVSLIGAMLALAAAIRARSATHDVEGERG